MALVRKSFAELLAELNAGLAAGRGDELVAETAQLQIIELMPGDWRLSMVFDHAVEVISDESFSTKEEAIEVIIDRMESCMDVSQIRTEPTQ
jgi:hypothetical protein